MRPSRFAFAFLSLLLGTACSSADSPAAPANSGLSATATADIGAMLQDEVETDVSAIVVSGATDPSFAVTTAPANSGVVLSVAQTDQGVAFAAPCIAPSNTTDTDGDGVYNDATFTFGGSACTLASRRGGSATLSGTLRIQDPTTTAGLAYNSTLTALAFAFTGGSAARTYSVSRTGTRNVDVSGTGLSLNSALTVQRTSSNGDATIAKQWALQFVPTTGTTIVRGQPLPSGALTVAGSTSWSRGTDAFSLTVSTPVALAYDATCAQPQRFTAGEVRARGSYNGTNASVIVRWTACGVEPTVTFLPI